MKEMYNRVIVVTAREDLATRATLNMTTRFTETGEACNRPQ
jgi:hypothetical protein